MPQLLTSNPPTMPFDSSLSLTRGKVRVLVLAAALLAGALGAGWLATRALAPNPAPQAGTPGKSADRNTLAGLDLSTFQKRGNVLVGETITPSGTRLRLVLDARTHELVGMRVMEAQGAER